MESTTFACVHPSLLWQRAGHTKPGSGSDGGYCLLKVSFKSVLRIAAMSMTRWQQSDRFTDSSILQYSLIKAGIMKYYKINDISTLLSFVEVQIIQVYVHLENKSKHKK